MGVQVSRHEDRDSRSEHAVLAPDRRLAPILHRAPIGVAQSWSGSFDGWLEAPRPAVKLIIDLEGAITAGGERVPSAWMGGLDVKPTLVGVTGRAYAAVDLELTPLGAYSVLGGPVSELGGHIVALPDLFGSAGSELAERVREAPDWDARFAVVSRFLHARTTEGPEATPAVAHAWRRLRASGGRVRVEALAAEMRMSRRHLTATFTRETGLGPKTAARLMRFAEVQRRMEAEPARWADIAASAGYSDQSHLNRECREFTGLTPSVFFGLRMESGGFTAEELPFVQDQAAAAA